MLVKNAPKAGNRLTKRCTCPAPEGICTIRISLSRSLCGKLIASVHHFAGSEAFSKAAPIGIQDLSIPLSAPRAYALVNPAAVESGLTNHQLSKELDKQKGTRVKASLS